MPSCGVLCGDSWGPGRRSSQNQAKQVYFYIWEGEFPGTIQPWVPHTHMLILAQALECVGMASAELSPVVMFWFVSGEGCLVINWHGQECNILVQDFTVRRWRIFECHGFNNIVPSVRDQFTSKRAFHRHSGASGLSTRRQRRVLEFLRGDTKADRELGKKQAMGWRRLEVSAYRKRKSKPSIAIGMASRILKGLEELSRQRGVRWRGLKAQGKASIANSLIFSVMLFCSQNLKIVFFLVSAYWKF